MPSHLENWFRRKVAGETTRWRGIVTVAHEFRRVLGPRSVFGSVTLSIEPCDQFVFESTVTWPCENYDRWVVDGILDAIFTFDYKPMLGARIVLSDVGWHDVDSAPIAYYWAAKNAVASLLAEGRRYAADNPSGGA